MSVKIYTKTGDKGETSVPLLGRVSKSLVVLDVVGNVDELNAHIGLLRERWTHISFLEQIQNALFAIGAQVACGELWVDRSHVKKIEKAIDKMEKDLPTLSNFILPIYPASTHLARSVCRRAERDMIKLTKFENYVNAYREQFPKGEILKWPIQYLNRLSDYLFVLSRHLGDRRDPIWDKKGF